MKGEIVLTVGFYPHSVNQAHGENLNCTPAEKIKLDELHKRKIDLADYVYIINKGGYMGDSTKSELAYAIMKAKPVEFMEIPT